MACRRHAALGDCDRRRCDRRGAHARAVAAGANVIRAPEEGPDGRLYTVEDLEGHRWMFNQS